MDKYDGSDAGSAPASLEDPWYDVPVDHWGDWDGDAAGEPVAVPPPRAAPGDRTDEVYLAVQRSPEFREVRSQYRRFVVPAAVAFLGWYLAYVIAATAAPGLMARQVAGAVNVALLAGLGQFATTFLLTWAYARHARLRRDQAALDLRWDVTMQTRRDSNL
ncbi:hypothetical protein SRB5_30910 [Streptomyces sp. RB5]|uniref:DUF485 domain-containing protein n=1 Tax=Streptomyces smaragdinus TaxID=2585196 RepID=A0A7K0CIV7_9ACTN|nr:hypothetical protein [Streptomyces smaragdinus]